MKDNFSKQASGYAVYRPHYPDEMIQYIMSNVNHTNKALDVATGNGQVAGKLAGYFSEVYGVDISQKQLENAVTAPNIYYSVARAEDLGFADGSFDLITVAQAIHWFNFDAFYKEVHRLLSPNGVFAVMGYGVFSTGGEADSVLHYLYEDILGEYWDPERRYIEENYQTIPFPFEEIEAKSFENRFSWTFDQLIGYLNTWSSVQHYINKNGKNPIHLVKTQLENLWNGGEQEVVFPLLLRIGKIRR